MVHDVDVWGPRSFEAMHCHILPEGSPTVPGVAWRRATSPGRIREPPVEGSKDIISPPNIYMHKKKVKFRAVNMFLLVPGSK